MKSQQKVKDLFADALERPAEQREAFLEAACRGDGTLREQVVAMLRAHDQAGAFMSSPTQPDVPFPDTRTAKSHKPAEGPGTVIGNYKLLQEIGHGGFGVVYMAEQEQPVRRKVALKIIKLGMDTKQVIARFEAERQALAMMDHPNIAKVLDAGATDTGRPYFVMELVRGVPVTEYCDTENLDMHSRLELFMQICHAVQHAHTKGIIHRDIKPSNVMITLHDGVPVPKVIDFGIAKAIHQRLTEKTLFTQYGQLVGTPAYMSPEQAEMSGLDIDTRSDIYSLGVLLYELLTGTTPFSTRELREGGFAEIQRIIREQEPHKPSTRVSSLLSEPPPSESDASEPEAPATGLSPDTTPPSTVARGATGAGEAGSSPPRGSASVDSMQGTLAGKLPVAPHTRTSVVDIARHRRTDPASLSRQLRGDLDWIVMKALEKDRTRRYETANGFAADVQRHLDDQPVEAGPPSAAYRLSKFVRRNRTGVITAAAVLALLLAGIAGTSVGLIRARAAEIEQNRARQEAERARDVAAEQRQIAQAAERDQSRARKEADNARQIAEERTEELRRTLYLNNIAMAEKAYNGGDVGRMNELLERCDTDLRAWEWGHLQFLAGRALFSPDIPFLSFARSDVVLSVAFNPDGKRIVAGSKDQTLKLWDVIAAELLTLPGHEGAIFSVAFSPDGKRIVSGSEDKTLKIWNASTGEEIMTLRGHDGLVSSVAFSPDGELIVSGSWDQTLKIWDADNGQEIKTLRGHEGSVSSAAFSPDGMRIVSGSWDKTLRFWNTKTGEEIRTFVGHEEPVEAVAFSPDGKWIASGSWDATVRLWDATTGEEIRVLRSHGSRVNSVAFSPNGQRIVSGSDDEMLKLWNAYTGEEVLTLGAGEAVLAVAFGPSGRVIVSGNDEEYTDDGEPGFPSGVSLKLWDVSAKTITLGGHDGPVSSVALSLDGKKIVSASVDKTLKIWDADSGEKIKTLSGHDTEVSSVAFSPDGMRIVSGSRDRTLKVWNTKTGEEIRTLVGHEGWVKAVAFSPDGRWIASGSEDKTVKVWDASTGEHILTLAGHQRSVNTVSFSPNGRQIVSGSHDELLKLWDASTGEEILSFRGHEGWVGTVAFSPSGEKIVSGSSDKTLKIWDVSTGKEILTLYGHIGSVSAVAFSPDGKRIVSGSFDKTLKVWDVSTGQETLTLRGHIGYVSAVAFSPDGTRIVSGSADGVLKVWKTWQESGRPRAETLD